MNRSSACFAALGVFAALPLSSAHAQQPSSITLSCNGTSKLMAAIAADQKPDAITGLGIVVNLTDRTVAFSGYTVPIATADTTTVNFTGRQALSYQGLKLPQVLIDGSIDRVTGATSVTFLYEVAGNNSSWELLCRPATRLF